MKLRYLILLLIALLGAWYFTPTKSVTFGDASGANSPGTMADDATVGTVAWTNPDNAKVSDNVYANVNVVSLSFYGAYIQKAKIVKSDGSLGSQDKGCTTSYPTTDTGTYQSFGGTSDLWGETWTPSSINNSNFGFVIAVSNAKFGTCDEIPLSHYLKATNFGFSIPAGATINGIKTEVEGYAPDNGFADLIVYVDHIRITVYYTVGNTQQVQIRSGQINVRSGRVIVK